MDPRNHPLFKRYPLTGTAALSTGDAPTPYHIYDGYGLFIGGTCERDAALSLLKPEALNPIQTTDGKVVAGIWICNFMDASLGAHHELQFSFFVPERDAAPLPPHPLNALLLMLTRPDVQMLCHGLWNNTPVVVAYNRELLSLNARLTRSRIEREARRIAFQFDDAAGNRILSGEARNHRQSDFAATWALMARLGFGPLLAMARQPWVGMRVLNPLGVALDHHAAARAFTRNDLYAVRYADGLTLDFGDTPHGALGFAPQVVQYMEGFKFVYLQPGQ